MTRALTDRARYGHIVKPLTTSRQPWTWLVLDSEAWRTELPDGAERQTFACAAVVCLRRNERHRDTWRPDVWHEGTDTARLWAWIGARCPRRSRSVLVAHNLAYDLRITRAMPELVACGWQLGNFGIDQGGVWLVWQRPDDGATLVMVDSLSWWQTSLEKIATALGMAKVPLPDEQGWGGLSPDQIGGNEEEAILAIRCHRDVEILATAWRAYLDWLAAEELGPWRMSGASQSWAAWRRRFYPEQPLFVRDPTNTTGIREFERKSAWTGRTEAWQHGTFTDTHEWDFAHAYASVARDQDLPREQVAYAHGIPLTKFYEIRRGGGYAMLCGVDVRTIVPVVPTDGPDGILWPVGTFQSYLWDCEVAELLDQGADVRIRHATYYETAPVMREMCTWLCDTLDGRVPLPKVLAPIVKHWSRTLVGRTAMTFPRWRVHIDRLKAGELDDAYPPWQLVTRAHDDDDHADAVRRTLRVGPQVFADIGDAEPADAAPFVQSAVMAHARVRLWRAMLAAGLENVLYVDTDSLIVNRTGQWHLARAHIPDLRHKAEYRHVEILGPRSLYVDGELRMAGLPGARGAERVAPGVYDVTVWPTFAGSLEGGEHDRVTVRHQRVTVHGTDHRREHLPGGATAPYRLDR